MTTCVHPFQNEIDMDYGLIIDKPSGITSHDVVARVRRFAGTRRVGHAGTLDPFATGVLIVCVGRTTRLVQFLVGLDKEYVATIRLGFSTDTQDLTGKQISSLTPSNELDKGAIDKMLKEFVGPQKQIPPMYSAKKVAGQRLYRAARAGLEVDRSPADIEVYSISSDVPGGDIGLTENADGTVDFVVRIQCSSGTYVRTLANDIGVRLGVGAHLAALRRTAVGGFRIEAAAELADLEAKNNSPVEALADGLATPRIIPNGRLTPAELVSHLPHIELDEEKVLRVRNGQSVRVDGSRLGPIRDGASVGLLGPGRVLIGVGGYSEKAAAILPTVVIGQAGVGSV
ncbi:MAG TPA: tRNA pseudouridine(55) synthase TruB [Blastocatellia bacterium]